MAIARGSCPLWTPGPAPPCRKRLQPLKSLEQPWCESAAGVAASKAGVASSQMSVMLADANRFLRESTANALPRRPPPLPFRNAALPLSNSGDGPAAAWPLAPAIAERPWHSAVRAWAATAALAPQAILASTLQSAGDPRAPLEHNGQPPCRKIAVGHRMAMAKLPRGGTRLARTTPIYVRQKDTLLPDHASHGARNETAQVTRHPRSRSHGPTSNVSVPSCRSWPFIGGAGSPRPSCWASRRPCTPWPAGPPGRPPRP